MWNFSFRVRKQKIDRYGLAPIELTIICALTTPITSLFVRLAITFALRLVLLLITTALLFTIAIIISVV